MPNQSQIDILKSRIQAFGSQFYIQIGHVKAQNAFGKKVSAFQDAFPIVFSENQESGFIFWKQIPIRFHYSYELYANIDSIILLLEKIAEQRSGEYKCTWLTDVYIVELSFSWDSKNLKIESNWMVKQHHQKMADLLNEKGALITTVDQFRSEWKPLLVQLVRGIEASGIEITDAEEKDKLRRIKAITPDVSDSSKIYSKDEV